MPGFADGSTDDGEFFAGPENGVLLRAVEEFCATAQDSDAATQCPYNPLVLHGPAGIGKTLLARNIARRYATAWGTESVVYLTGADFAAEYACAVAERGVPAWRQATRTARLLVIDDLSALAAKRPAQIELRQTIDTVIGAEGQVLITAPKPPNAIADLLPALAGRVSAGLVLRIAAPGIAARRAAIERFVAELSLPIDAEAQSLLAAEPFATIPELRGVLCELHAHGGVRPVDRAQVQLFLSGRRAATGLTVRAIAACTARHLGLQVADLRGPSRRQNIVAARAMAMYLSRQLTGKSLDAVGRYFGGRDHTTVLHACRKTEELIAADPGVRQNVTDLRALLRQS